MGKAPARQVASEVIEGAPIMQDEDPFDCREALHRIYHFLDGELTADRRKEIESHLNRCSPCLDLFGFEAELRRVVADRCRDAVPSGLRERIAEALHHEHQL